MTPLYNAIFDTIFCILVVAVIWFFANSLRSSLLPYARHEKLFTAAERNFYFALKAAVGSRYTIFGKVRVADLVQVTRKTNDKRGYAALAKIAQKHIDYVLCDPSTLAIVCAVELNDSSHERKDRINRDRFITDVFKHIKLPIAWVNARASYDVTKISAAIENALVASQPINQNQR